MPSIASHLPDPLLLCLHLIVALILFLGTQPSYSHGSYSKQTAIPAPCQSDQASTLLQLRRTFLPTNASATAFRSRRAGTDCCDWEGVGCGDGGDADGYVTSLDLNDWRLESSALDPVIFTLTSLRYLDLALNDFNGSQLPSFGFEQLSELTYLNLSSSGFQGRIPVGIRCLTKLESLDLSASFCVEDQGSQHDYDVISHLYSNLFWYFVEPNMGSLIGNLSNLKELYLDRVDLSGNGVKWCGAFLNSSTPELQVLSLRWSNLSGPICGSLSGIRSITEINLQLNYINGPTPESLADLPFLRVLVLSHNHLEGWFPTRIFQHRNITSVDIRYNHFISGSLPNFSSGSSLTSLLVSSTNFSGPIPSSISNLKSLKELGTAASDYSQELPSTIGKLKSLRLLEVTGAAIVGTIPSWLTNLTSLESLRFSNCGLFGEIPLAIGNLQNLTRLDLSGCNFSGMLPPHLFNLTQLGVIKLGSNNFIGTIELRSFWKLPHIFILNLSNNKLTIITDEDDNLSPVNNIITLGLASCNISKFPNTLRRMHQVIDLDLSDNDIHGSIPQWAWETWKDIQSVNLSHNKLSSIGYISVHTNILNIIDLSFNLLGGPISIAGRNIKKVDFSSNRFSSISLDFGSHLSRIYYFKASRNLLSGRIPPSICNATSMRLLDLSYNKLSGSIPTCLLEDFKSLNVLNLKSNQLHEKLPQNITNDCALEDLDFSDNLMEGQLPRSLAACRNLQVVDMGNNQIHDTFPCWMGTLHKLQVLILKSNKFIGKLGQQEEDTCEFASLHIFDLASNNFSGILPNEWFKTMKSMMVKSDEDTIWTERVNYQKTYQFTAAVTYKGNEEVTLSTVLKSLAVIDVSDNSFHGPIPQSIGDLVLLRGINMSYNAFTGSIPFQFGALNQLEALDLSSNDLSGEIPQELISLDFLSTLNLSYNELEGRIPESPHFLTFTNLSFVGNTGLCGLQVSKACSNITRNVELHHLKKSIDIVLFLFVGLGFGVGFSAAIFLTWGIRIRIDMKAAFLLFKRKFSSLCGWLGVEMPLH